VIATLWTGGARSENACLDNIFGTLQRARVVAVVDPRGKLVAASQWNLTDS
jgi:hypothetical protein